MEIHSNLPNFFSCYNFGNVTTLNILVISVFVVFISVVTFRIVDWEIRLKYSTDSI
jgi:hypothetical protein